MNIQKYMIMLLYYYYCCCSCVVHFILYYKQNIIYNVYLIKSFWDTKLFYLKVLCYFVHVLRVCVCVQTLTEMYL